MMIYILSFIVGMVSAQELKAAEQEATTVSDDKNANEVRPTYTQIDNATEKSKEFSWGTLYYTSVTHDDDHDHSGKLQTHLNVRYVCKDGGKKSAPQRFEFCGYAHSEVDTKQRELVIAEMRKAVEHKNKTTKELNALYDQEYNDRIVDPVKNMSEAKSGDSVSVNITVRNKEGRFGSCETKLTHLNVPISCK